MRNILFIGANAIKERTTVHSNVDDKNILSVIKTCQDINILPALGTGLYERLQTGVQNNDLTALETSLLNDFVTDCLVYYVLSELPFELGYQFYNKGLIRKSSDNTDIPSMQDLIDISSRYRSTAEFYTQRMIKYLKQNYNSFPLYLNPGTGVDVMHPEHDGYKASIYLGDDYEYSKMSIEERYQGDHGLC